MNTLKSAILLVVCVSGFVGCGGDSNNRDRGPSAENFSDVSRAAFAQSANDTPAVLNDRNIVDDVTAPDAFDDLITSGTQ